MAKNKKIFEDYLGETPMKNFEKFGCVSFASANDLMIAQFKNQISTKLGMKKKVVSNIVDEFIALEHPKRAVKYLGGRSTIEECKLLIDEAMENDNSFHIYTINNGMWVTFDPSPELINNEVYREEQLNELMKEKKIGEARTKQFFLQIQQLFLRLILREI